MDVVIPKLKELWPRMCAHALRCVKDADKVKDIMQDTFEKLYSSRIDFSKVADIEAYIFRVLCNVIADTVKKDMSILLLSEVSELNYLYNDISLYDSDWSEVELYLHKSFEILEDDEIILINMIDIEEYSIKEVAKINNMSQSGVRKKLAAIHEKMKIYILSQIEKEQK